LPVPGRRPAPTRRPIRSRTTSLASQTPSSGAADLRGHRLAGGVDQLVHLALERDDGLPDAPDAAPPVQFGGGELADVGVVRVSASASRRSTVSGVRSRCDRSATSLPLVGARRDQAVRHPV
jgi:hypothetical protein